MFYEKAVLKYFPVYYKETPTQVFSYEFWKIFKNSLIF